VTDDPMWTMPSFVDTTNQRESAVAEMSCTCPAGVEDSSILPGFWIY